MRHQHRSTNLNKDVVTRLNIAHGHLGKVTKMVADGDYCLDVIQQIQAVRAALAKTETILLANHLKTCVDDKNIDEVIKVFEKGQK
jgi:DNA-binding FrmR family transcriptional regulator